MQEGDGVTREAEQEDLPSYKRSRYAPLPSTTHTKEVLRRHSWSPSTAELRVSHAEPPTRHRSLCLPALRLGPMPATSSSEVLPPCSQLLESVESEWNCASSAVLPAREPSPQLEGNSQFCNMSPSYNQVESLMNPKDPQPSAVWKQPSSFETQQVFNDTNPYGVVDMNVVQPETLNNATARCITDVVEFPQTHLQSGHGRQLIESFFTKVLSQNNNLTEISEWEIDQSKRRRATPMQTSILEQVFQLDPLPSVQLKKKLAEGLGMTPRRVQIW